MRTSNFPSVDDDPKIFILPWLSLEEPTDFAGVSILPRADAIERGRSFADRDVSDHVRHATSYFGSGSRYPRSFDLPHDALTDDDVKPELVEPSVIFLEGDLTLERVDDVIAALNFACMAKNGGSRYTNAVVFERYIQTLAGRAEYIVPMSRQMYGSKTTTTRAINLLNTRPHRCGQFQSPDAEHWSAIAGALDHPAGARSMEAVRKLLAATQDIETIPEDLERSLYAIALERLLSLAEAEEKALRTEIVADRIARGVDAKKAAAVSSFAMNLFRAQKLLRPLLGPAVPAIEFGYHIMRGWNAIRRERNGVWHADEHAAEPYGFEKQRAVRLNLIWFRVTQALIIASLVDAGFADVNGNLALWVMAIEAWLGAIVEGDTRPPDVASATAAWWASTYIRSNSFLLNRDDGTWRRLFSDTGRFNRSPRVSASI